MIDNLALGLIHFLLAVMAWKLLRRPDLDREGDAQPQAALPVRRPRR